jgi:cytidylate kinase
MKSISIAGDLGSGKSSVAKVLCEKLGFGYFSTGMLQRKLAEEKGMNTLEMNYFSETTSEIDDYIDSFLKKINDSEDDYILDSRLAWYFVKRSFKIYLTVLPEIAANRVLLDKQRKNEPDATDIKDRIKTLLERKEVENRRFKNIYNIDCLDFNNYDAVIDTSYVSVNEIVELVLSLIESKTQFNRFWCSPKLLYPTEHVRKLGREEAIDVRNSIRNNKFSPDKAVDVVKWDGLLYIWDGHKRTSGAILNNIPFIPVNIIAEGNDKIHENHTAKQFVESAFNMSWLYDWEDMHSFRYLVYPSFD